MANYEVWGRKEFAKGKRQKLAYGIGSDAEVKRVRQELIIKGSWTASVFEREILTLLVEESGNVEP